MNDVVGLDSYLSLITLITDVTTTLTYAAAVTAKDALKAQYIDLAKTLSRMKSVGGLFASSATEMGYVMTTLKEFIAGEKLPVGALGRALKLGTFLSAVRIIKGLNILTAISAPTITGLFYPLCGNRAYIKNNTKNTLYCRLDIAAAGDATTTLQPGSHDTIRAVNKIRAISCATSKDTLKSSDWLSKSTPYKKTNIDCSYSGEYQMTITSCGVITTACYKAARL